MICGFTCKSIVKSLKVISSKYTVKKNGTSYFSIWSNAPLLSFNVINSERKCPLTYRIHTGIPRNSCDSTTSSSKRLIRQEPGLVRLGFIPDEWFTFFFKKTGVSGGGTFLFTFMIYLMSKEILVMEHEYYGGLSVAILCIVATKKVGPMIAKMIDKELDEYEKTWTDVRTAEVKNFEDLVKHENRTQWSADGQLMLIAAKRENVHLQLEADYRERLMKAFLETKKRLDYCVTRDIVEAAIARRQMTKWVIKEVEKGITEKIQTDAMNKCFEDLQKLAQTLNSLKSG